MDCQPRCASDRVVDNDASDPGMMSNRTLGNMMHTLTGEDRDANACSTGRGEGGARRGGAASAVAIKHMAGLGTLPWA